MTPSPNVCVAALLLAAILVVARASDDRGPAGGLSPGEFVIHSSRITGVAFSPDGRLGASASHDGVKTWDVATRRPRGDIIRSISGFSGVAFSPDGRLLACLGFDGLVALRDLEGDRECSRFRASGRGSVRSGAFSPDGACLATGGDDEAVHLWDIPSGRERSVMHGHRGCVTGLAFADGGRTLVSVGTDGLVLTWDVPDGKLAGRADGGCGPLRSVAISPDGRRLAVGGRDGITLRDPRGGQSRTRLCRPGMITSVRFLPGGSALASSSIEGAITLWDVPELTVREERQLGAEKGRVLAMTVSPDGMTLLIGSDHSLLKLWEIARPDPAKSPGD